VVTVAEPLLVLRAQEIWAVGVAVVRQIEAKPSSRG